MSNELQTIPISSLYESSENSRHVFDDHKLQELAQSIQAQGIKVRLIVRQGEEGKFEIVAGARRFRAAQLAGQSEVPCEIREYTDAEARDTRLIENLQRADLTPLEEAESYQQRLAAAIEGGKPLTASELAQRIGKNEKYVRFRLRLSDAIPPVKEALHKEKITLGHALEIVRFAPDVQANLLRVCFTDRWNQKRPEAASVSELRRFIEEAILLDLKKAAFDTDNATLIPEAGACTDCPKRTGNDRMLFNDVKKGDICSDPGCFGRKLERAVDVRIEMLEAKGKKVVRISSSYNRTPSLPKDALTTGQYDRIANEKTCDDTAFGVLVDGSEKGRQIRVCTNAKCAVHGFAAGQARGSAQDKEKRAKARAEGLTRWRIFQAIFQASSQVQLQDEDYLKVVEFAIWRAEHNGLLRTAKVVGWDKELFSYGGREKLRAQLGKVDFDQAMSVALLASVSSELTVSEYNSAKAERLEALARSF